MEIDGSNFIVQYISADWPEVLGPVAELVARYCENNAHMEHLLFEVWNNLEVGVAPQTVIQCLQHDLETGLMQGNWA